MMIAAQIELQRQPPAIQSVELIEESVRETGTPQKPFWPQIIKNILPKP